MMESKYIVHKTKCILLLFLILSAGCHDPDQIKGRKFDIPHDFNKRIAGDWWVNLDSDLLALHFVDSTGGLPQIIKPNTFFWKDDTLMISGLLHKGKLAAFKFFSISDTDLVISSDKQMTAGLKMFDTLRLVKIRKLPSSENLIFKKVYLCRTGCYGSCPMFELQLNSDGTLDFHGEDYVDSIGNFKGSADSTLLSLINEKMHTIDFNSIKRNYSSNSTCNETVFLDFTLLDVKTGRTKEYKIRIYGTDEIPFAVQNFIDYLTAAINKMNLTRLPE